MVGNRRLQIIGLGVLAVVTAILVVFSLPQVRNPSVRAVPSASAIATTTPSATTPAATPSPTPKALPEGLAGAATLLAGDDDVSILVLGDGSGDEADEWVSIWAKRHVARTHQVSYQAWDAEAEDYGQPVQSGSKGSTVTIWNASTSAPSLGAEDDRVAKAWQPADIVMLSYGHRQAADALPAGLGAIRAAVKAESKDAIILAMIQNPDQVATEATQRDATLAVAAWAKKAGLDTVDVYDAFLKNPERRSALVEVDGSPTPLGSEIWAKTLADTVATAA